MRGLEEIKRLNRLPRNTKKAPPKTPKAPPSPITIEQLAARLGQRGLSVLIASAGPTWSVMMWENTNPALCYHEASADLPMALLAVLDLFRGAKP